jgi:uncharacterized protein (DUF2345 family)
MSVYDHYTGDTACNILFTSGSPTVEYPAKDIVNVFGPIYTPRVYGSELTALEIASSGNVTIALNDVHALDLWNASSVTTIQSLSNNSLKLVAGPANNATFGLSTSNFDVSTYSQSNINFAASNKLSSTSYKSTEFTAYNDFTVTAESNVSLTATQKSLGLHAHGDAMSLVLNDATDNATLTTAKDTVVVAHNDFSATADSNVTLTATNKSLALHAHNDAMSLVFSDVTDNATLTSAKTTAVVAHNNFTATADSNVSLTATNKSLDLSAHGGAMTLNFNDATDNATLTTAKNTAVVAHNDFTATADSNVSLTATNKSLDLSAHGGAMTLNFNDATDNATLTTAKTTAVVAHNDFTATADSNVTLTATNKSLELHAHNDAMSLVFSDATDNATLTTAKTTAVVAHNDFTATADSNVTLTATNKSLELHAHSDAMSLVLDSATDNATLTTAKTTAVVAHNNFTATADSNATLEGLNQSVFLKAHNEAVKLTLDHVTDSILGLAAGSVQFNANDQFVVAASNAASLTSATSSVSTTAATNITSTATGGNVTTNAGGNVQTNANGSITSAASNNFSFTAVNGTGAITTKGNLTMSSSNDTNNMFFKMDQSTGAITISAPNGVSIAGGSGDSVQNTQSAYVFNVQNQPIVSISQEGLQITGILDTVNIHETELWIQDKLIYLSAESNNEWVEDGTGNEASGIRVNGNPYAIGSNEIQTVRKSLLWHNSTNGVRDLGGSHKANTESYWELQGGHLRLTHNKNNTGKKVSYIWRVNDLDELEFVKSTVASSNDSAVFKVVAKFGNSGTVV